MAFMVSAFFVKMRLERPAGRDKRENKNIFPLIMARVKRRPFKWLNDSPLRFCLHHTPGDVQMVQVFALDDHFAVGRVEGLQHHTVAALDVAL